MSKVFAVWPFGATDFAQVAGGLTVRGSDDDDDEDDNEQDKDEDQDDEDEDGDGYSE